MSRIDHFTYSVSWSDEDECYVALVAEYPSVGSHGDTPEAAMKDLYEVMTFIIEDDRASKQS